MLLADALREIEREYRPILLLHLDFGKSERTIRDWVDWCADLGYGGAGLIIEKKWDKPAMDREWYKGLLGAAEIAVSHAKMRGLDVWIFDEWGYPSGTAAGLVCATESYRSKKLHVALDYRLAPGESITFQVPERTVSAGAIPLNKYWMYAPGGPCRPIACAPGDSATYTAGETYERVVVVTWEYLSFITHASRENRADDYSLGTIDLLNPDAVRRFTEVMHEPYYERLKDAFGTVIKGFFYDEPELCFEFPWTAGLERTFLARKGYDLREQLPILMAYSGIAYHPGWEGAGALIQKLTADYRDVWTQAAADAFYGGVQQWCHDHGILSVGHQDTDNHTETLCSVSGDFFKNNAYNDHPGIDVIWDNIELGHFNDFPRYAGSCKRLLGKSRSISETFAEMGVAHYPDRMRFVLEQQIVRGVDEFVLMISDMEPEGVMLNCFSPGNAALERFGRLVNAHVGRAAQLSQAGVSGAGVAVYVPIADIYRHQQAKRDGHTNNSKLPWDGVDAVARALCYYPCDFQYIWDDPLLTLPLEDGTLRVPGGQRLHTVVLPPYIGVPDAVMARLKAFVRKGGRVIAMDAPFLQDEGLFTFIPSVDGLCREIASPVQAVGDGMISLCHRLLEDGSELYMLLNEAADPVRTTLRFPQGKGKELYEIDMLTGGLRPLLLGQDGVLDCMFGGGSLRVFVTGVQPAGETAPELNRCLTVDAFELTLPDDKKVNPVGVLPTWDQLGLPNYSGDMHYSARFTLPADLSGDGRVLVSLGDVRYSALLSLDGGEPVPLPFFPFEAQFSGLKGGEHTLSVTVLNTPANALIGSRQRELETFGGHTPVFLNTDRKYLTSGLLGPVTVRY